jgi:lactoylglutathione lyase
MNVKQAVPFFSVVNMNSSLKFYVEGSGFTMQRQRIPEADGKISWCWLEIGDAAIMLQEFRPQGRPYSTLGEPLRADGGGLYTAKN